MSCVSQLTRRKLISPYISQEPQDAEIFRENKMPERHETEIDNEPYHRRIRLASLGHFASVGVARVIKPYGAGHRLSRTPSVPDQSQEFYHVTSCAEKGICACHEISDAYKLLHEAATTSIAIPPEIVTAVNEAHARTCQNGGCKNPQLETGFWNAYGLLSSIKPADRIIARYKCLFYVILTVLLSLQAYSLIGSMVMTRLTNVENEYHQLAKDRENSTSRPEAKTQIWDKLRRTGTVLANYDFAKRLVPMFKKPEPMPQSFYDSFTESKMKQDLIDKILANIKLKSELELYLMALNTYILPLFYGALGAFAFILRKLSDPVTKLSYAHDIRTTYWMRLNVGALAGLAVGWFFNGNSPGLAGLSPLALAFVAGYAFDPFFSALDKIAATFGSLATSQSGDGSRKPDNTYSGKVEALQHSS